jgi:hypothetical protein
MLYGNPFHDTKLEAQHDMVPLFFSPQKVARPYCFNRSWKFNKCYLGMIFKWYYIKISRIYCTNFQKISLIAYILFAPLKCVWVSYLCWCWWGSEESWRRCSGIYHNGIYIHLNKIGVKMRVQCTKTQSYLFPVR